MVNTSPFCQFYRLEKFRKAREFGPNCQGFARVVNLAGNWFPGRTENDKII
jgi:hypothetical protein